MSDQTQNSADGSGGDKRDDIDDLVASVDTGGRAPDNRMIGLFLAVVAFVWSAFQLWYASPVPYAIGIGVFNTTEARAIHLAFALFLGYLFYPALKRSPRDRIPVQDWVLAIVAASTALYLYVFYEELSNRPNNLITQDVVIACIGAVLLLEATRRALGPPLMIVAIVFLGYTFLGPYAPGILAWKGTSFQSVAYHQWISTEGVFGIALGVSTDMVFLFVLFGALLEGAGAGNYFIKVAFALMGHLRGGPAKAAVVASASTGLISGSSIANVVTTGTFTIPMMKRVGFTSEKAGAVEVASSVNGQLMPPVMGAAAFLMVEYTDTPYVEVVKHAFLPAVISYIALVYIVHLEAVKQKMKALPRSTDPKPARWALLSPLLTIGVFGGIAGGLFAISELWLALDSSAARLAAVAIAFAAQAGVYLAFRSAAPEDVRKNAISTGLVVLINMVIGAFGLFFLLDLIRAGFGDMTPYVVALLILATYVGLVAFCARYPDLEMDDPNSPVVKLPLPGPTIKSGLHFLLPVVLLIWCLMVERLSPSLSAFWATAFMILILLTQRWLFALFRKESRSGRLRLGISEFAQSMIAGARNMIGIGIATATAGIIVGAVSQTGVGLVLAELVEILSMGNILLILLLTAVLSLILGMGLPTTANYIVVSSLLAPVIVQLGQQNGLIVPLIAVHLFVFYFGIMADVTPPVGLASFAAAAVSGGDPIRTGFVAFFYSLRTALLPFLFIFNTQLLLMEVGFAEAVLVFIVATAAMLVFTAAMQGFFLTRSRLYETLALLLVAFTLFRPGFWMDLVVAPYDWREPTALVESLGEAPVGAEIRARVDGLNDYGEPITFSANIPVMEGATGEERLEAFGLLLFEDGGEIIVDGTDYNSPADEAGFDFDQVITEIGVPAAQPPKELMWIPGLLLLLVVAWAQRRRGAREAAESGGGQTA
ncbi:TRAP transporter permease [Marivibrio halodurans]|uniref:TRAP transporter permease n=1 Tax=Marivibrio halodurans TaxID=2039722 RepID=A0A8J7S0D1_9PROT|nr:TRAP transporter permease [Marivibrio halodurans]MBP5857575.1 TRAP transporter permease [Marivibrio halodurans]